MARQELPPPSMWSVLLATAFSEWEAESPGVIDRMIARLDNAAARATIIKLRGPRTEPDAIAAQEQALEWLSIIRPLIRAEPAPRKAKR